MGFSISPDDLAKYIPLFRGLPVWWQLGIVFTVVAVISILITASILGRFHRERFEVSDGKLQIKDATIQQKDSVIEELRTRLESQEALLQTSIVSLEHESNGARFAEELANLRKELVEMQRPILEFTPSMLIINPKDLKTSIIQVFFQIVNLGGASALRQWQASVRMPARTIHLVEGVLSREQQPTFQTDPGHYGKNLVADDRIIEKGGKRSGWVEFLLAGDPDIDGSPLDIRQVHLSVSDYTGHRYTLSMPPGEPLPPRALLFKDAANVGKENSN
jgi:hypothetical protein